jgi:hypothetical protein
MVKRRRRERSETYTQSKNAHGEVGREMMQR